MPLSPAASGDVWFLAILNGTEAKTIDVPLAFLGEGDYRIMAVKDRKDDPAAVDLEESTTRRDQKIKIELNSGGGFIARFSKN